MTWTAATGTIAGSIHNTGTFATNGGLTTHTVGNTMLIIATCHNPSSGNEWCTGFTSTTPNTGSWTQITTTHNDTNTQLLIDSSNDVWSGNIWAATVTSVSTDNNLTATFSGPDNPPAFTNFVAMEFHTSVGSWNVDTSTFLQNNTGTNTWPSMTAAGSGELYFGYAWDSSSAATPGSNPDGNGFHYNANADTTNNGAAWNLSYPSGTSPVWGDSNECFGVMVLLAEGTIAAVPQPPAAQQKFPPNYQQRIR